MKALNFLVLSTLGLSFICAWKGYGIRYNASSSLPCSLYVSMPVQDYIEREDVVAFRLNASPFTFAKIVTGIPGDHIRIVNNKVYVEKREIGEVLDSHEPIHEQVIPEGFYFMSGVHPESFDSRYAIFGLISKNSMRERLWPIY